MVAQPLAHGRHPGGGVGRIGPQRLQQGALESVEIVRVHQVRLRQLGGGAGELAEQQSARLVGAGGDELLRDQVHAVAQRGDRQHVGDAVEGGELRPVEGAGQVVHGHRADPAELAVDPGDVALDPFPQLR